MLHKMKILVVMWILLFSLSPMAVVSNLDPQSVHSESDYPSKSAKVLAEKSVHNSEAAHLAGQEIHQTVTSGLLLSREIAHSTLDSVNRDSETGLGIIGLSKPECGKLEQLDLVMTSQSSRNIFDQFVATQPRETTVKVAEESINRCAYDDCSPQSTTGDSGLEIHQKVTSGLLLISGIAHSTLESVNYDSPTGLGIIGLVKSERGNLEQLDLVMTSQPSRDICDEFVAMQPRGTVAEVAEESINRFAYDDYSPQSTTGDCGHEIYQKVTSGLLLSSEIAHSTLESVNYDSQTGLEIIGLAKPERGNLEQLGLVMASQPSRDISDEFVAMQPRETTVKVAEESINRCAYDDCSPQSTTGDYGHEIHQKVTTGLLLSSGIAHSSPESVNYDSQTRLGIIGLAKPERGNLEQLDLVMTSQPSRGIFDEFVAMQPQETTVEVAEESINRYAYDDYSPQSTTEDCDAEGTYTISAFSSADGGKTPLKVHFVSAVDGFQRASLHRFSYPEDQGSKIADSVDDGSVMKIPLVHETVNGEDIAKAPETVGDASKHARESSHTYFSDKLKIASEAPEDILSTGETGGVGQWSEPHVGNIVNECVGSATSADSSCSSDANRNDTPMDSVGDAAGSDFASPKEKLVSRESVNPNRTSETDWVELRFLNKVSDFLEIANTRLNQIKESASEKLKFLYASRTGSNPDFNAEFGQGAGGQDCVNCQVTNNLSRINRLQEQVTNPTNNSMWKKFASVSAHLATSLLRTVYLFAFSTTYGASLWTTFISERLLSLCLPEQLFGCLKSKIYPVYLKMIGGGQAVCFLFFVILHSWTSNSFADYIQCLNLALILLSTFVSSIFVEPRITAIIFGNFSWERGIPNSASTSSSWCSTGSEREQIGDSGPSKDNDFDIISKRLNELQRASLLLNYAGLAGQTWHLYHLSQRLVLG